MKSDKKNKSFDHPNIQNEDWRLQAITTLTKDWRSQSGILHKEGTPVMVIDEEKYRDSNLTFGLPNITALFIDLSYKLSDECSQVLIKQDFISKKDKSKNEYYVKNKDELFNFFEKRMAAVIFAYNAIESFANDSIPEKFTYSKTKNDTKCTEIYNKTQIERWLNLDEKLNEILPEIYEVDKPKGKHFWSKYKSIKNLRNRIIHIKSKDKKSSKANEKTLWTELLNEKLCNTGLLSKNIIEYYYKKYEAQNIPRWLTKYPYN